MLRRAFLLTASALFAALAALPLRAADIDRLYDAVGLPQVLEIMRLEGIAYGGDLAQDLFDGRGSGRWERLVADIYDLDEMEAAVREELSAGLTGADTGAMLDFFESERGRRIIELEISARRALLDDTIEDASRDALDRMILDEDPLLDKLETFVAANDLVDSNVVGAMNSNVAFYTGLAEGGAFPGEMTESEILSDVWRQEPEIRDETEAWLYSYLAMAYKPLPEEDLDAYIAFSESAAGQQLNRALFAAFDAMFLDISLKLGRAAARFLGGQEL